MLDRVHRLSDSQLFATTVRRGRRAGSATLVVHFASGQARPASPGPAPGTPPQVGLVVSKAVGNAVVRNQVKRRLRHLARERLDTLPDGSLLVVRARPAAATASYGELASDLDRSLARVLDGAAA